MLTALRVRVSDALKAGDVPAFEYVGEAINPPCAAVVPAEPYMRWQNGDRTVPFGHVAVGVDVLLLAATQTAKGAAAAVDALIEEALAALDAADITPTSVSRPGVVTLSGSKFIGSVLSIEEITEEP